MKAQDEVAKGSKLAERSTRRVKDISAPSLVEEYVVRLFASIDNLDG